MSTLDQVEAMVERMKGERESILETKALQIRALESRIAELDNVIALLNLQQRGW